MDVLGLRVLHSLHDLQNEMSKMSNVEAPDAAATSQDGIPMTEMDKAAVLTLIREEVLDCAFSFIRACKRSDLLLLLFSSANQIISKEIEVNEWKTKYEETKAEVCEMR